jgi:hypothetical protein
MWRFAILTLVACTEHGQTPPGGGDASVPGEPRSLGPFAPQICSGGTPGDSSCPFNSIGLDEVGAPGSSMEFLVQPIVGGLSFVDVALFAGQGGLHVEHPQILAGNDGNFTSTGDTYLGVTVDLRPGASETLPSIEAAGVSPVALLVLRFDAIGPLE